MNFLDANAIPIDIFGANPNLAPFRAILPDLAADNLMPPANPPRAMLRYFEMTDRQNLTRADMANPRELNEIIWHSVKGDAEPMPGIARLPAFDILTTGVVEEDDDDEAEDDDEDDD